MHPGHLALEQRHVSQDARGVTEWGRRTRRFAFVLTAVMPLVGACGSSTPVSLTSPSPIASASPSPTVLTCTLGGPASPSFTAPWLRTPSSVPIVSAVVAGDTLTLTFDQGTPEFEVTLESAAQFMVPDGRGDLVNMAGSAGAIIVLRGFQGGMLSYAGSPDLTSNGPLLLEVRHVNEYEGYVHWAVGLSKPGCTNVTIGSSTLTFHFIPSPFINSSP
jgi:hypothetical protein